MVDYVDSSYFHQPFSVCLISAFRDGSVDRMGRHRNEVLSGPGSGPVSPHRPPPANAPPPLPPRIGSPLHQQQQQQQHFAGHRHHADFDHRYVIKLINWL